MIRRLEKIYTASNGGKMSAIIDFNTSALKLIQQNATQSEWINMIHRIEKMYGYKIYANDSWAATDWFRYVRLKNSFIPEKIC